MTGMRLAPALFAACSLLAVPALAGETRSVSGFNKIELMAPVDLEVRPGKFGATLEMDSEVASHLTTEVKDETLRISLDGRDLSFHRKQKIKVTMPEFRGVSIQGSGDADIAGFKDQDKVGIAVAGSGDVKFSGSAGMMSVSIQGSGDVLLAEGQSGALHAAIQGSGNLKAPDFKAKNVSVAIEGSGDADIRVAGGALKLAVNGSGDIRWSGEASAVSAATHGSGTIAKR